MTFLLCLGSNHEPAKQLAFARQKLMESYPDIRFSHEVETLPIGLRNEARFHNQVARFQADATIEEVRLRLKHIEHLAGRNSADKQREIIRLDIDLLQADNQVLKPQDMAREWMEELLNYLTTHYLTTKS
jgi:2-amino-4-hydroxy-6-hydroxymethyldihydropteridine diphosphokinase